MTRINEFGQPVGDPIDWQPATPPLPTTLTGRRVRLVPLETEHATDLWALRVHPQLWTYLSDDLTSLDTVRAGVLRMQQDPTVVPFAILGDAGTFLGRATYLRIQPAIGTIEVGSVLYSPALQRTPAATEAQYLLMRHAFEDLGYRRYEWKCDSLHAGSRRAARRLGFVEEGTWRNATMYKGRTRDTTWFSITDAEWPSVGAVLERWLAPDNFDEAANQRRRMQSVRADEAG